MDEDATTSADCCDYDALKDTEGHGGDTIAYDAADLAQSGADEQVQGDIKSSRRANKGSSNNKSKNNSARRPSFRQW